MDLPEATPVNKELLTQNWQKYTPKDLQEKTSKELQKTPKTARRRPRTLVKALTTNELSKKYDRLLDERLDMARYQKTLLENKIKFEKDEHELKIRLLKSEIEVQKKKLLSFTC